MEKYILEEGGSIDESCLHLLPTIYAMGKDGLSFDSICSAVTRYKRSVYTALCIPTRTAQGWSSGERSPSPWQLPLIAYAALSLA